jgi:hypothetical protein
VTGKEIHFDAIALLQVASESGLILPDQAKSAVECLETSYDKVKALESRIENQSQMIRELRIQRVEFRSLQHSYDVMSGAIDDFMLDTSKAMPETPEATNSQQAVKKGSEQ